MKVAIVAEWLDPWRGGAETSTLQFLQRLRDHGLQLHVFTRSRPSPAPDMHVHTISGAAMSRVRQSVTFAHRVARALDDYDFDIVHAMTPLRRADIYHPRGGTIVETIERNVALRRSTAGRAVKRCVSRLNFKQRHWLKMERSLLGDQRGPLVVAISDYVVRQMKRHYALPDGRIRKVFNAVEPPSTGPAERAADRASIRRELGLRDNHLVVLSVAHNFKLKGVHRWMEALARLAEHGVTDVRALVVGKGDSQAWHRLAARLGIEKVLTFVGPTDRMTRMYHAGDLLVHPTYYDPCSRVVLEALASGLPCITTRWDGAAEVIEDGRNGYVLDEPDGITTLADRVVQLRDPELRSRMSKAAKAVTDRISMARHTEEILALYNELRSSKRASKKRPAPVCP